MRPHGVADEPRGATATATGRGLGDACDECLGDLRFRALLSAPDWDALPPAVRRRFSRRLAGGKTAICIGRVTHMRRAGWCLVHPRVGGLIRLTATFREAGS